MKARLSESIDLTGRSQIAGLSNFSGPTLRVFRSQFPKLLVTQWIRRTSGIAVSVDNR